MSYLYGPVSASSSWVRSFGFWLDDDARGGIAKYMGRDLKEGIIVTFKDGARCFYEGTTESQYNSLLRSSSKGKWIHANLVKRPYTIV